MMSVDAGGDGPTTIRIEPGQSVLKTLAGPLVARADEIRGTFHSGPVVVRLGDRKVTIVGTVHISESSIELVKQTIAETMPDVVCIELDEFRFAKIMNRKAKRPRFGLGGLAVGALVSWLQKRLGKNIRAKVGGEFKAAAETAEAMGIRIALIDRSIDKTLGRVWQGMSSDERHKLFQTKKLGLPLLQIAKLRFTEEDMELINDPAFVAAALENTSTFLPGFERALVAERDAYMTQKIRDDGGKNVVVVVGAGHVDGMRKLLESGEAVDLASLEAVKPLPAVLRFAPLAGAAAFVAWLVHWLM